MAQTIVTTRPAYQEYQILYIGFIVAPFLAGLDEVTHVLTNWDKCLAPVCAGLLPVSGHAFMLLVGVVRWPPRYWWPFVPVSAATWSPRGSSESLSICS